jgi:hypothetical protein
VTPVAKHPIALRNSAGLRTMRLSKAGTQMHPCLWSRAGLSHFEKMSLARNVILITISFAGRIKQG